MEIVNTRISATPRSKYVKYGVSSSVGGSSVVAPIDTSNFVKLTGATEQTVSGNLGATGDIIAYQTSTADIALPIASSDALGTIKVGEGLSITEDGTVSVTGGSGGSGKAEWGYITGTLSSQTDLWNELQKKADTGDLNISNWDSVYTTVTNNSANWNTAYKNNHTHSNKSYLDSINQSLSRTSNVSFNVINTSGNIVCEEDIYANNKMYTQTLQAYTSVNTKDVTASGNVKAQGDVIAYSTGTSSAPFKYWRPSVDSSGNLSWSNSTSETTPSTVNIKGPKGDKGEDGKDGADGSSFNGGTITRGLTIDGGGAAVLALQGNVKDWQAAQIQLINEYYSDYRRKWTIDLAGTSEQSGDLCFQNYNSSGSGSANASPWYRMKIFKYGTATNAVAAAGAYVNTSDERLKNILYNYHNKPQTISEDGTTISNSVLDRLKNLESKYFFWKTPDNADEEEANLPFYNTIQLGFIAQEVEKQFPEFVTEDNGYKQLNYAGLGSFIAVEASRELNEKIEQQQAEIDQLKQELEDLKKLLNQ
ncbi:putative uncharacterized protein [Parabacteroides sp. CAG:409]|nr:putative uncharacterized protein [Parabacteroides sp. CAG:409]